jgi:hypothetical protein
MTDKLCRRDTWVKSTISAYHDNACGTLMVLVPNENDNALFDFFLYIYSAFEGVDVVFHTEAADPSKNNLQLHYKVNVQG